MVYQTSHTNCSLVATNTNSNYKEATDYLSNTTLQTKRWIKEGVVQLEQDELKAYLKFVIAPAIVSGVLKGETLEEIVHASGSILSLIVE